MPRQSGILNSTWSRCDRSGEDWPLSELRMQNGLLLCPYCYDNPIVFYREWMKAQNVSKPAQELDNETAKIRQNPNIEWFQD